MPYYNSNLDCCVDMLRLSYCQQCIMLAKEESNSFVFNLVLKFWIWCLGLELDSFIL